MLVITNKFIPGLNKRFGKKKDQKLIADTPPGDLAYYISSLPTGKGKIMSDDTDSEDDDDADFDDLDFAHQKAYTSFTGSDWRPVFNDRLTMFIAGTPGAGKSYLAKQMINLLPTNIPILLFTALEESDGNFADLGKDRLFKIKMKP